MCQPSMLNAISENLKSQLRSGLQATRKTIDEASLSFDFQVGIFANREDNQITWDPSESNATLDGLNWFRLR